MMAKGPFYIWLEHRSNSCVVGSSIWSNFINFYGSNLLTCKVTRSDCRSWCSCGEIVVKRINILWTDGRDVHYPTDEPSPAHVERWGRGKVRPDFFKPAWWFGAKIVPPKTSHGMGECSDQPLVYKPLGWNWWNLAILLAQIMSGRVGPQSGPKHKVALRPKLHQL